MIKIWGRPTSIHTQRVLWALADVDLPYELTLASATMGPQGHVSKGGTPFGVVNTPAYLAMNPNGTVPTIDDNGLILWESNAILMWLALRHAPDLLSGDAQQQARAVQWMTWINGPVEPLLHTLCLSAIQTCWPCCSSRRGATDATRSPTAPGPGTSCPCSCRTRAGSLRITCAAPSIRRSASLVCRASLPPRSPPSISSTSWQRVRSCASTWSSARATSSSCATTGPSTAGRGSRIGPSPSAGAICCASGSAAPAAPRCPNGTLPT